MPVAKVLIVATSRSSYPNTDQPTGSWVEEIASPYYLWREAGFTVDIASIKGGEVPFDPASKSGEFLTPEAAAFLADPAAQAAVAATPSVADLLADAERLASYDAIFLPGGHGIVWDGDDEGLKTLLEKFWAAGKVVSAVCHGPCGLLHATDPATGQPIVKGRAVTGFSNSEEKAVGKDGVVPYLLEDRLRELGGAYVALQDWAPHALADGSGPTLVTGQNPGSSKLVAERVIDAILPPAVPSH